MNKTKLISVRVDEDTLSVLENAAYDSRYGTRSDAINAALRLMAVAIEKGLYYEVLRFRPSFDEVDSFDFKYHRRK